MRRCLQLNRTTCSTNLRLKFEIIILELLLLAATVLLHVQVVTCFKIVSPLFSTISLSSPVSSSLASSTLLTSSTTTTSTTSTTSTSTTSITTKHESKTSSKDFHIDISWNIPNVTIPTDTNDNSNILTLQTLLPKNGIILMDGFCPYHGGYVRQAILFNNDNANIEQHQQENTGNNNNNNNTTIVINVCSRYLEAILQSQQIEHQQQKDNSDEENDSDLLRIPSIPINTQQVEIWKEQLYTTIVNQLVDTVFRQNDDGMKTNKNRNNFVPRIGILQKEKENEEEWMTQIHKIRQQLIQYLYKSFSIRGVYCESDSGLQDAEIIRQLLPVQCYDTPIVLQSRRNKFLLHETITQYFQQQNQKQQQQQQSDENSATTNNNTNFEPLFTIPKQCLCTTINEIYDFITSIQQQRNSDESSTQEVKDGEKHDELLPNKVVVKPIRGVASELVSLCTTKQEIEQSFTEITSNRIFGKLPSSLLQEDYNDKEEESDTNDNNNNSRNKSTTGSSSDDDDVYHTNVLVQEYIEGTEYAIDVVSCNGIHKIAAVWKYDKRPVQVQVPNENIATSTSSATPRTTAGSFCYYQTLLIDSTIDPINYNLLCTAVQQLLDALGIKYGITHTEFIIPNNGIVQQQQEQQGYQQQQFLQQNTLLGDDDDDDNDNDEPLLLIQKQQSNVLPVLIEVNCRQHNMDFCPITMSCIRYNALDMVIDSLLLDPHVYDSKYPTTTPGQQHFAYGCMVHLVNTQYGILQSIQHVEDIYNLDSTYDLHIYDNYNTIGQTIEPTRNIRTDAGWVQLINSNYEQLQNDYNTIINQYMPSMFQVY